MSNDYMRRGLNQALYKYLPEAWADFYVKKSGSNYTMFVKYWNAIPINEYINKKRLLKEVGYCLQVFKNNFGKTDGFGNEITSDCYDILTPRCSENSDFPDIRSYLSPLTFFCKKCKKVYLFENSKDYLMSPSNRFCKECKGELEQLRLVYSCECGWTGPVRPLKCTNHGFKYLKYNPDKFSFLCSVDGNLIEMLTYCPECKSRLFPRNALDRANFIPFSLVMIDFLDPREEKFLVEEKLAPYIVVGYWLDLISLETYNSMIQKGNIGEMDHENSIEYKQLYRNFINMGFDEKQAIFMARSSLDSLNSKNELQQIQNYVEQNINRHTEDIYMQRSATSILEYKTIKNAKSTMSLEKAIEHAMEFNTIKSPKEYEKISREFGISQVQASGEVPLINCTYGYTRRESDPKYVHNNGKQLVLKAFPTSDYTKKIYAAKLTTEGILFELDRRRIIKWLIKNEILDENIAPEMDDEKELKLWFLNNIDLGAIHSFIGIDNIAAPYTYHVYNLLHSMCHALLREAGILSGLDKNSLAEYIFPAIPAFFIYCQNSQGLTLGSLFSLFSAHYNKWLLQAKESIDKCIFDPICIDRDKACVGCLHLNEMSCKHFNKDLNRRYLIGYYDHMIGKRIYGYWEEELTD